MPMIVTILTGSYPYSQSAESTFLDDEVKILLSRFDRVILVPLATEGVLSPVPQGAEVDLTLAQALVKYGRIRLILKGLFSGHSFKQLFQKPWLILHPRTIIRTLRYMGSAKVVSAWGGKFVTTARKQGDSIVFYSFWLNFGALGIGLLKHQMNSKVVAISRAHGGDLYEERHVPAYIPFRGLDVSKLDWIAPDSSSGTNYLRTRFPLHASKTSEALMGVRDPGQIASPSKDGKFRIVSCSFLVDVKRVDLLIRGISVLANRHADHAVEWNHFGDGPNMSKLMQLAKEILPKNVAWQFHGHLKVEDIYKWYGANPVDVFVNVSESEGTPVSIMEAISFSIPVVATSVGGNKEAVTNENGILLGENPSENEVANALEILMQDLSGAAKLREGSRRKWASRYCAENNYHEFADTLEKLSKRA